MYSRGFGNTSHLHNDHKLTQHQSIAIEQNPNLHQRKVQKTVSMIINHHDTIRVEQAATRNT
jgi:hypothetical protein